MHWLKYILNLTFSKNTCMLFCLNHLEIMSLTFANINQNHIILWKHILIGHTSFAHKLEGCIGNKWVIKAAVVSRSSQMSGHTRMNKEISPEIKLQYIRNKEIGEIR